METWYVLENGDVADPKEVTTDKKGVLRHKSGVAVAMKGDVPHSRGVDIDPAGKPAANTAPAAPKAKVAKAPANRELKAKGAKKYETR
jgi:hypothetical protein